MPGFPDFGVSLDSSRLQRLLSARGWLGRFNPVILNRAMDDVRSERVIALRHEVDAAGGDQPGWQLEATNAARWQREMFSPEHVEARRLAIQQRGRQQ